LEAQAHTGNSGSSDETIIQPRPENPAVPRELTSRPPPSTNTLVEGGWNMDDLAQLEKRLARYLGPIAKVMVRRGAKETTDLFVLAQMVASKIPGTAEREEFLKGTGVAPSRGLPTTYNKSPLDFKGSGTHPTTFPAAQRPLSQEDIARVSQLLVT